METQEDPGPTRDDAYRIYDARSIGRAIRSYREAEGLTQAQLAEKTGVNRQYIIELEHGLETEQVRRMLRVFRALGLRMTLGKQDW